MFSLLLTKYRKANNNATKKLQTKKLSTIPQIQANMEALQKHWQKESQF